MNISLSRSRYIAIHIFLITLALMLKLHTVGSSTTLTDCAAILDGPFIEGQDSPSDINFLEGNEIDPVVINCQVTCLNHSVPGLQHNPRLALIVTELGKFKDIRGLNHTNDTEDGLYLGINYTSSSNCEQANNYTMQYTFAIYLTRKMDRTVTRCGVSYHPRRPHCWGEAVTFIRYNASTADNPTPTDIIMTTTPCSTMNYMGHHTPPTNLALNQNGTGTGGGGSGSGSSADNLLTIFVVILALALAVFMAIAIIEGMIIAVSHRRRYHNKNNGTVRPLNANAPDKASVESVTPPNELRGRDPPHD